MPNWNAVLKEVAVSPLDSTRHKYLKLLHENTGRNVICYYSGWLQKPSSDIASIRDDDKNGFMATAILSKHAEQVVSIDLPSNWTKPHQSSIVNLIK